ncbi:MAG: hypothetical protein IPF79_06060, partial [Ignavibacteria bacterium]|nr:hypothetical protein [Ignavibacteria bacterium]
MEPVDTVNAIVSNKKMSNTLLPQRLIYPLITSTDFKSEDPTPSKWVLLPYNSNGKPLDARQLDTCPELLRYLESHKTTLQNRKGVMLKAMMSRGAWWALLGVGPYCFQPYKIVWEAYGKSKFKPKIFDGKWQVNQSLQAFVPVKTMNEAERVLAALSASEVERYLLSLKMPGSMNWAQPGKIRKLITFEEDELV